MAADQGGPNSSQDGLAAPTGLSAEPVIGLGYHGTFWRAAEPTVATVVWIGGAAGGHPDALGTAFASAGISTLAIAYFGTAGLAPVLEDVAVEVAIEASRDARRLSGLQRQPIAIGVSRGSELALLAAAHYPDDFAAVVGIVPSSRVHGLRASNSADLRYPWRLRGNPVPLLSDIPIDRIAGPILLLSAEDDQVIPSPLLSERALRLRGSRTHPLDAHVCYPGAGHTFFRPPGDAVPDPADARHPSSGEHMVVGGTLSANAVARDRAWSRLLEFIGALDTLPAPAGPLADDHCSDDPEP